MGVSSSHDTTMLPSKFGGHCKRPPAMKKHCSADGAIRGKSAHKGRSRPHSPLWTPSRGRPVLLCTLHNHLHAHSPNNCLPICDNGRSTHHPRAPRWEACSWTLLRTTAADRALCPPFHAYHLDGAYDEMFTPDAVPRPQYEQLYHRLLELTPAELEERQRSADLSFLHQGITFTVYSDARGTERIFPYDLLPRIITAAEWDTIERGLIQRITALNLFLHDIYHKRRILADKVVPHDLVFSASTIRREMNDLDVPHGVYVAVTGTDLIRGPDGQFVVLEDNLRVPSGASYMLANRQVMKRVFPNLFGQYGVRPLDYYGQALLTTLRDLSPRSTRSAIAAMTTPTSCCSRRASSTRPISSTPSSPARWASRWSKGRDLVVHDNVVYMRTTAGLQRVDVIYRRIDDDFVDPLTFRKDSMLGVPGLFNAYRARQRHAGQCHRHRCGRRQGGLCLCARHHPLLPGRRRHPGQRATPISAATTRSAPTCSTIWTNWSSRPWANRAATAC